MALMHCHYHSRTLGQNVDVNVIIPTPEGDEQITSNKTKQKYHYDEGLPVLYLLHGAFGDYSSWTRFSNVERYVQQYGCAVVMASAQNSFYQNMHRGGKFHDFYATELPEFIQSVFNVKSDRESTYIAGLSMGGYGAWHLALSHPEKYAKTASLSGVVDVVAAFSGDSVKEREDRLNPRIIFKDGMPEAGSQDDLLALYDECVKNGLVPDLYQACGTEDFLYDINLDVKRALEDRKAEFLYEEGPGEHNWDFWDAYIKKVLAWIFE